MEGEDNTTYCVDSSFILSFLLPDEDNNTTDYYFKQFREDECIFVAPHLLRLEIVNGIKSAVVRNRITRTTASLLIQNFLHFAIVYREIDYIGTFDNAFKNKLSAYDAAYLSVALNEKCSLLSYDKKLKEIAYELNIPVLKPDTS